MSSGKVLLGLLAGVAAGALLGVLFAPDKGSATRKNISKKSTDYADAVKEKFNEFLDSITEKFEQAKEDATEATDESKGKSKEAKKDAKTATAQRLKRVIKEFGKPDAIGIIHFLSDKSEFVTGIEQVIEVG